MAKRNILQIIPSENWWAVYNVKDKINVLRLVCWALVEETDDRLPALRYLEGITEESGSTGLAETECFSGYVYASTEEEAHRNAVKEHERKQKGPIPPERW